MRKNHRVGDRSLRNQVKSVLLSAMLTITMSLSNMAGLYPAQVHAWVRTDLGTPPEGDYYMYPGETIEFYIYYDSSDSDRINITNSFDWFVSQGQEENYNADGSIKKKKLTLTIPNDYTRADATAEIADNDSYFAPIAYRIQVTADKITIQYDTNGSEESIAPKTIAKHGVLFSLPEPHWTGHVFEGWYTAASGGTPIRLLSNFSKNTTIHAHWTEEETESHTVTFKVKNGSWNDGTRTDKTVTLSKWISENRVLTLTQGQIPGVGLKPDTGYKAGSWDTVPTTETPFNSDKVFTYTYDTVPPEPPTPPAPPTPPVADKYSLTSGSGSWIRGSGDYVLTINPDEAFDHFTGLFIDNRELTPDTDYKKEHGSLKLTIKSSVLSKLSNGNHRIEVGFNDGNPVAFDLTVKNASRTYDDDDDSPAVQIQTEVRKAPKTGEV